MSDDLDFDMEVVEEDELGELGAGGSTNSERRTRSGRKEPVEREPESLESRPEAVETRENEPAGSSSKKRQTDTDATARGENYITGFGRFPSDWKKKGIAECAEIRDSERIPLNSSEREEMQPGDIPYYGANGVVDYVNDHIFDSELILLAEDGGHFEEYEERPVAYRVSGKAWINNHAHILEAKDGINTEYLFYSLEHRNLVPYVSGSTRSKLTQSMLRKVRVPIPSLPEQRKIASVLNAVDQAIQKTEATIEQAQRVKRGLMQDLFQNGPNPEKSESEETRFGPFLTHSPTHWNRAKIGDLYSEYQLGTAERGSTEDRRQIPLIKMGNLNFGTWDFSEVEMIDYDRELLETYRLQKGDLLFNTRNTPELVGKTAVWDSEEEAIYDNNLLRLRFDDRIDSGHYVNYYLSSSIGRRQLRARVHGTTSVAAIYQSDLEQVKIPVPPVDEQRQIVQKLRGTDQIVDRNTAVLDELKRIKKGLMQDLLTGEVRTADKAMDVLDEVVEHG
jgi:type I restriction enzyme S subunit